MDNSLASAIRQQLRRYLDGDLSPEEFREWFGTVLWNIDENGDQVAEVLAYDIELAFAEVAAGAWSQETLRERLHELANTLKVQTN